MPLIHQTQTPSSPERADSDIVKVSPPSSDIATMDEKDIKLEYLEGRPHLRLQGRGEVTDEKTPPVDDVQGMVDETVRRVREQSDRIQAAALPYANKTRSFAENKPVLFTFIAIFSVLSVIPICCFVAFVISATLFILGVAAVCVCASVLGTILLASAFLLPTLFVTSLASLTILSFLLTLFLLHRLYLHLGSSTTAPDGTTSMDYENLSKGVKAWIEETAGRVPDLSFDYTSLRPATKSGVATPRDAVPAGYTSKAVETETDDTPRPRTIYSAVDSRPYLSGAINEKT